MSRAIGSDVWGVFWMFPGQQFKRFLLLLFVCFWYWDIFLDGLWFLKGVSPVQRIKVHKIIYAYFYSELCILFLSKQLTAWFPNAFSDTLSVIYPLHILFCVYVPLLPPKEHSCPFLLSDYLYPDIFLYLPLIFWTYLPPAA